MYKKIMLGLLLLPLFSSSESLHASDELNKKMVECMNYVCAKIIENGSYVCGQIEENTRETRAEICKQISENSQEVVKGVIYV